MIVRLETYPWFGVGIALLGALMITPDTLLIRLSGLDGWSLSAWRGILIGVSILFIWSLTARKQIKNHIEGIITFPFAITLFASTINSLAFNFATIETSVTVVLSTLSTAPVIATVLSFFILKESPSKITWFAITFCVIGVLLVIFNAGEAPNAPPGNVFVGGLLSFIAALGLSIVFVLSRKYKKLPILLAVGLGIFLSGLISILGVSHETLWSGSLIPIFLMGIIVMPLAISFLTIAPRYTTATTVSLFMLLELVLGPFWVWLGTDEQPTFLMILGAFVVLLTLLIYILIENNTGFNRSTQFLSGKNKS